MREKTVFMNFNLSYVPICNYIHLKMFNFFTNSQNSYEYIIIKEGHLNGINLTIIKNFFFLGTYFLNDALNIETKDVEYNSFMQSNSILTRHHHIE